MPQAGNTNRDDGEHKGYFAKHPAVAAWLAVIVMIFLCGYFLINVKAPPPAPVTVPLGAIARTQVDQWLDAKRKEPNVKVDLRETHPTSSPTPQLLITITEPTRILYYHFNVVAPGALEPSDAISKRWVDEMGGQKPPTSGSG